MLSSCTTQRTNPAAMCVCGQHMNVFLDYCLFIIEICSFTENLDIASYKGLPNQGGNPNRRGSFDEYRYPLGTPTESEPSEPMLNELKSRHTDDYGDNMGDDHDNADAEVKTVVVSTRPLKGIQGEL